MWQENEMEKVNCPPGRLQQLRYFRKSVKKRRFNCLSKPGIAWARSTAVQLCKWWHWKTVPWFCSPSTHVTHFGRIWYLLLCPVPRDWMCFSTMLCNVNWWFHVGFLCTYFSGFECQTISAGSRFTGLANKPNGNSCFQMKWEVGPGA